MRNKIKNLLFLTSEFDILCFTETHLDANILDRDLAIAGFSTIFRKDRNCFGGGVMVYISDSLKPMRESPNTTCKCIWLEICNHTFNIFLCCTYRPPNSDSSFWENIKCSTRQQESHKARTNSMTRFQSQKTYPTSTPEQQTLKVL